MEYQLEDFNFTQSTFGFNVDTRDFSIVPFTEEQKIDAAYLKNKYFSLSLEEVKDILYNLYTKTGGKNDWRMIAFTNDPSDKSGWDWQYINVYPTEIGYVIGSRNKFYRKSFFETAILHKKELISAHSL